ncbi:unnamed protein product [Kuraishia capsulata CBS 1993]|uniref:PIG-P domain-containing protein n=1 Tax=Kuraishia capsulata CBS 1993 TaxID=1382522 RepID=W6MLZ5_9ASCO|nr:uncharacterized protein KUCA_T00003522001 [Kuraishia capsulata CBS 1993]CDK27544.1 unnamed protein product [Kuraishia capsulata CBS 1993]
MIRPQINLTEAPSVSPNAQPEMTRESSASPGLRTSALSRISISTTSLTSLLPSIYGLGKNQSMPVLQEPSRENANGYPGLVDGTSNVSDLLARESDVTVSTNVTSQAEYKGFASYVISGIFLFIWLFWALLPDSTLNYLQIYYYPSRWWAVAIPSYILISMVYTYIALALYNIEVKTPKLDDARTISDDTGVVVTQFNNFEDKTVSDKYIYHPTSGIWDLPLSTVNEVLYLDND